MAENRGTTQTLGRKAQGKVDAKMLAYWAMASGALMAAQPADAAIVYSGVQNLPVAGGNTVLVDLDGDTVNDFQFRNASISSTFIYNSVKPLVNNALGQDILFDLPLSLAVNAAISWRTQGYFTQPPYGLVLNLASTAVSTGFFYNGTGNGTGYLGVRFQIAANTHYGWIRYDGTANVTGPVATGFIMEWAYENTPDASILAGETPVDTDHDGIADVDDNCPAICNTQQLDADNDGVGDVCDTNPSCGGCGQVACEQSCDTDNDGILNASDNCPTLCNSQQLDADSDDTGDVCDTTPGCGGCGQVACEAVCTL